MQANHSFVFQCVVCVFSSVYSQMSAPMKDATVGGNAAGANAATNNNAHPGGAGSTAAGAGGAVGAATETKIAGLDNIPEVCSASYMLSSSL